MCGWSLNLWVIFKLVGDPKLSGELKELISTHFDTLFMSLFERNSLVTW